MNIFKSYKYTWWQIGIFKLALLSIGALIGAYWHDFFLDNQVIFIIIAIIASIYILYVSLKKANE